VLQDELQRPALNKSSGFALPFLLEDQDIQKCLGLLFIPRRKILFIKIISTAIGTVFIESITSFGR